MKFTESHIPKYTKKEVEEFSTEGDFMDAGVELFKQLTELVWFYIDKKYHHEGKPIEIEKDEAVLAGTLIRYTKLSTSFLQNICECKSEIAFMISRSMAEAFLNIKFFIKDENPNTKRNFIKYSLIQEKEFLATIKKNIANRDNKVLPIEERMLKSIENSFDESDFDLDEVQRSSNWKSISARSKEHMGELFYTVYFGIGSHVVHGNWQDLITNHLSKTVNGFIVTPEWTHPRPQLLTSVHYFTLEIIELLAELEPEESDIRSHLLKNHRTLFNYSALLHRSHELFMQNEKL